MSLGDIDIDIDDAEAITIIERFSVNYGVTTPPTSALQAARRAAASVMSERRTRDSSTLLDAELDK